MGRVPKLKKQRPQSQHSRAARRAPSPTHAKPPATTPSDEAYTYSQPTNEPEPASRPSSALAAHHSSTSGISKRKKSKKQHLSRAQRLRKERGMARADVVSEQLVEKVRRSRDRGRSVRERRVEWEDLNGRLGVDEVSKERRRKEGGSVGEERVVDEGVEAVIMGDEVMVDVDGEAEKDMLGGGKVNGSVGVAERRKKNGAAGATETTAMDDIDSIT